MSDDIADVVIIGGGVIGSAAAYFLALKKLKVRLVERLSIGSGTSSSSGMAVARQTKPLGVKQNLVQKSLALYKHLISELDEDFEFRNQGGYVLCQNDEEMAFVNMKVEKLQAEGVDIRMIDMAEAHERLPYLSEKVIGVSFCSEDSSVNPLKLVRAYRKGAEALGAHFSPYTEVTGIETDNNQIQSVVIGTEKISTPIVVNAAGPYSAAIGRMAGVIIPLLPRKGEILVTEATGPFLSGEVFTAEYLLSKEAPNIPMDIWNSGEYRSGSLKVGVAATQTKRGNLLIGSTRELAGFDTSSSIKGMKALMGKMVEVFPAVMDLIVIRSYAGLRPSTPDGLPIVSTTDKLQGFILATGHEGDGIALSPITGKMVAELATSEYKTSELASLALNRFAYHEND